jgi:hypothetical protein
MRKTKTNVFIVAVALFVHYYSVFSRSHKIEFSSFRKYLVAFIFACINKSTLDKGFFMSMVLN